MSDDRKALSGAVLTTILAMICVAGAACFFTVSAVGDLDTTSKVNRDGISCILEQLNAHRMNSYTSDQQDAKAHQQELMAPAPAPQPLPQELLKACDRFFEAPR